MDGMLRGNRPPLADEDPRPRAGKPRLEAIADVWLEAKPTCRGHVRWFYGELIGLPERPNDVETPKDLCFASDLLRLRVRVLADALPSPNRRRALISVPSLASITEVLISEGFTYEFQRGLSFFNRRICLLDPAQNLIELKEEWPL